MDKNAYENIKNIESHFWWHCVRRNILSNVILKFGSFNKNSSVLDIGCGTGGNFSTLQKLVNNVVGREIDEDCVSFCKMSNQNLDIEVGFLPNNLNINTRKFDCITMLDVLEHIDNEQEALSVVKSHLTNNGFILLMVPAYKFLWNQSDECAHHKRRYTYSILRKNLIEAGFEIEYISYFNTVLFFPVALAKIITRFKKNKIATEINIPLTLINKLLYNLFNLESFLIPKFKLPFGISLVAVVRLKNR